jgi:hypothetical protein
MALGVLDVEFSIGIDQPDRTRGNFLAVNIVGHLDGQDLNNDWKKTRLERIDDPFIPYALE